MTTSWGGVAGWYDDLLKEDDTYQAKVILPNLERLLDVQKGEVILDLACGQGFFSHIFSRKARQLIGVDISKELIAIAEKNKQSNETFYISPSDDLSMIDHESIDTAFIVLALQNIEKLKETFLEVSRVLKKGGKFFIVLNHPTFRIPKQSSWGYDEDQEIQYRRIDAYLSESRVDIDMHPGQKGAEKTVSFHRPLQTFFKQLGKAGFAVSRLEEWNSHKKSEKGKRSNAEDQSRKEIPLFMCLEAVKL